MANQREYATTLGLVSDAFVFCCISSQRISWKKVGLSLLFCSSLHFSVCASDLALHHQSVKLRKNRGSAFKLNTSSAEFSN